MYISHEGFEVIASLDLDPIKVKLMHKESGEGWTLEKANDIDFEYRRFLYLMKKYPNESASPTVDVDTFWHYHILDTIKYAEDCEAIFGYFLHHFPYLGLRGEADLVAHRQVGERMRELYEETFGEPYMRVARQATTGSPDTASAYSVVVPAAGGYSIEGTDSAYSVVPVASAYSVRAVSSAYSVRAVASAYSVRAVASAYSVVPAASANSARANGESRKNRKKETARPAAGAAFDQFFSQRPRIEHRVSTQ